MRRKMIYRILIIILAGLIIGVVYLNTNTFISKQQWKHRDGGSIGDWIEFDDSLYSIKGRTIFKNGTEAGKVLFCIGKMLIVKEIATGETGYYINKKSFRF